MFFATPVLRRANFVVPGTADFALQRFLQDTLSQSDAPVRTPVQLSQDDKATSLSLDVPGLSREQLDLEVEGAVVRLSSVEGAPRQIKRAWKLEHDIDLAQSQAKLENGVLTLTLARLAPENKSAKLNIA